MQTTIYIPDTAEAKEVRKRVEVLRKNHGASFSDCVFAGLKLLVRTKRPKIKGKLDKQRLSRLVTL